MNLVPGQYQTNDNRLDMYQSPDPIKAAGYSICAIFAINDLTKVGTDYFLTAQRSVGDLLQAQVPQSYNIAGVKFANQQSLARGTGFLIGTSQIITVNHIPANSGTSPAYGWAVFGYQFSRQPNEQSNNPWQILSFPQSQVYMIVDAQYFCPKDISDWKILKLDRVVENWNSSRSGVTSQPLALSSPQWGQGDTINVSTISCTLGMPLKYCTGVAYNGIGKSPSQSWGSFQFFNTSLAVAQSASGSPVFDSNMKVIGLVSASNNRFYALDTSPEVPNIIDFYRNASQSIVGTFDFARFVTNSITVGLIVGPTTLDTIVFSVTLTYIDNSVINQDLKVYLVIPDGPVSKPKRIGCPSALQLGFCYGCIDVPSTGSMLGFKSILIVPKAPAPFIQADILMTLCINGREVSNKSRYDFTEAPMPLTGLCLGQYNNYTDNPVQLTKARKSSLSSRL